MTRHERARNTLQTRRLTASVLSYSAMRVSGLILAIVLMSSTCTATAENNPQRERRQRAAAEFHDGLLLFHASSGLDSSADGFRQDPLFYYFTGLGNTVGAVLAIDGKSGESWLFLPSQPPFMKSGLQPEVKPGLEDAKRLGIEHVVDWSELKKFLASQLVKRRLCTMPMRGNSLSFQRTFLAQNRPAPPNGYR